MQVGTLIHIIDEAKHWGDSNSAAVDVITGPKPKNDIPLAKMAGANKKDAKFKARDLLTQMKQYHKGDV